MEPSQVTAASRNLVEPDPSREGLFPVDAGATDSLVDRPHLEVIGLRLRGKQSCRLAGGADGLMDKR